MKVLFLSLPKSSSDTPESQPLFKTPPTTHLWLAALLLRDGHQVAFVDAIAHSLSPEQIYAEVEREAPDIVGVTVFTCAFHNVVRISEGIKARFPAIKIFAGGYHVNSVPEDFRRDCFDFAFIGEAEKTLPEVMTRLEAKATDFKDIPGLVHFDKTLGEWCSRPPAPFIQNFDDHPILPYEMVLANGYNSWWTTDQSKKHSFMATVTGKGCPMACSFCDISKTEGMKYRCMSAERVLQEIGRMVELGITHIEFRDPFFTVNTARVKDIAQGIIDHGYKIEWGFSTTARKIKDMELLKLLKRSGCRFVFVGIESGDPAILMREKKLTHQQAIDTIGAIKSAGIDVHCSFIFGLEGDTKASMEQTLQFAKVLSPTTASFSIAVPYPGTAIWDSYLEKGWIKTKDWSHYGGDEPVFETPEISAEDLKTMFTRAHHSFYFRPSYILRRLFKLRSLSEFRRSAVIAWNLLFDAFAYKR
jgi:anaerobic magnesium-protoporphyrin IX monomethyl ester cyclase